MVFYPFAMTENGDGTVNTSPSLDSSPNTYVFMLGDGSTGGQSGSYGTMIITVGETYDECEFSLDLAKIAEKLGADPTEFKVIEAQFGRLGQEWFGLAGASSGPWLGVLLCCGVTGCVLWNRKRRRGSKEVPLT
jgi:hypothetical protein